MAGELDRTGPAAPWAALGLILAGLLLAVVLKLSCPHHGFVLERYSPTCYSDIEPLYSVRGLSGGAIPYREQPLEYPVLTGSLVWALAGIASSGSSFFWMNVAVLALLAVAATAFLRPMVSRGGLAFWAIGPPLIVYAFVNWDLLAVAPGLAGLYAYQRRRNLWSGAALGLGASAKLFPAFLFPVFLAGRVREKDWRGAARLGAGFLAVTTVVNLPWVIAAPKGWFGIWRFHAFRFPEFETFWYWIFSLGQKLVPGSNWVVYITLAPAGALLLFAAGYLLVLLRSLRGGSPVLWGLAGTLVFFVTSHVYSPQYALWIVPLVLVAGVPWRYLWAFAAADLAVFFVRFRYFQYYLEPRGEGWLYGYEVASLVRMLALVFIMIWAINRARAGEEGVRNAAEGSGNAAAEGSGNAAEEGSGN